MSTPSTPLPPPPALTPDDETASVGWVAPDENGRVRQMKDTVPHLAADNLELRWLPNAQATAHVSQHATITSTKSNIKALRPAETKALQTTVKQMSKPLSELRGVLEKKFKDGFRSYYPQFGLIQTGGEWKLPYDYDDLEQNLREKLIPALTTHGFQDDPDTGTAVWTALWQALKTPLDKAKDIDANRSEQVGIAKPLDETTTLFLRCVVLLVRAHYPTTWESVLRGWGWSKTRF